MVVVLLLRKIAPAVLGLTFLTTSALPASSSTSGRVLPGVVVVKFRSPDDPAAPPAIRKSAATQSSYPALAFGDRQFQQIQGASILPVFPEPRTLSAPATRTPAGVDRIFYMRFPHALDPFAVARILGASPLVEYAEPHYIAHIDADSVNDPDVALQGYLEQIHADSAWSLCKGSSSVLIGTVDSGVEWKHPDLAAHIAVDSAEDINDDGIFENWPSAEVRNGVTGDLDGIDNDGNGYVDDVAGWDFAGSDGMSPDNDPTPGSFHGTHVSGIASAVTNNGVGIAGIAYAASIIPVKTGIDAPSTTDILFGYEGIKYAADRGAMIINCSWGGPDRSQFAEDIVRYAEARGAIICAAAGNSNSRLNFYPADYPGVLSVTSVSSLDVKSSFSNYNYLAGVAAPGENVYSTVVGSQYGYSTGTSMASPMATGVAALVAAFHPSWTMAQVREQVRISGLNIDGLNPSFVSQIGYGRLDAVRALTVQSPAVRLDSVSISDSAFGNSDGVVDPGETITVGARFENYLLPASNVRIVLTSPDTSVDLLDSVFVAGSIGTLESADNFARPFRFRVRPTVAENHNLQFVFRIAGGTYSDYDAFTVFARPAFRDSRGGNVILTFNGRGNLGFDDYPSNALGHGFTVRSTSNNLLFEGAFMAGVSSFQLVDVARDEGGAVERRDLAPVAPLSTRTPGFVSDQEVVSEFGDSSAGNLRVGLDIAATGFAFNEPTLSNAIIVRYRLRNVSGVNLTNLYGGLFLDWDIGSVSSDVANLDLAGRLGYVDDAERVDTTVAGVALLSKGGTLQFRAINNAGDLSWGIYDGFSKAEKWEAISSGISKTEAGAGDVSFAIGAGPFNLVNGDSAIIGVAIIAGPTLALVESTASAARLFWQEQHLDSLPPQPPVIPYRFVLTQNYPNPFNPGTHIRYELEEPSTVQWRIYNILGQDVTSHFTMSPAPDPGANAIPGNHELTVSTSNLASGVYLYRLVVHGLVSRRTTSAVRKMVLLK